jgi:hypothetical protein
MHHDLLEQGGPICGDIQGFRWAIFRIMLPWRIECSIGFDDGMYTGYVIYEYSRVVPNCIYVTGVNADINRLADREHALSSGPTPLISTPTTTTIDIEVPAHQWTCLRHFPDAFREVASI